MPNFEPWIRNYNYSKDYFSFLFNQYAGQYVIAYPCDYYALDYDSSVKEDEHLYAGTYEKYGVGDLSGYLWKKIYSLPVYGIDTINPQYDSSDNGGLTLRGSLTGQLVVPDIYDLKCSPNDIVDLNFAFAKKSINIAPLFVVSNIHLAHIGNDYNIYQLSLRPAPFLKSDLEKQISGYYHFYEVTKKILPLKNMSLLTKLVNRNQTLSDNLKDNYFDSPRCFFIEQIEED